MDDPTQGPTYHFKEDGSGSAEWQNLEELALLDRDFAIQMAQETHRNSLDVGSYTAGTVLTYTYTCSICGKVEKQVWHIAEGNAVPRPCAPYGWRYVLGPLVCKDHRIRAELRLVHPDGPKYEETRETDWRTGLEL